MSHRSWRFLRVWTGGGRSSRAPFPWLNQDGSQPSTKQANVPPPIEPGDRARRENGTRPNRRQRPPTRDSPPEVARAYLSARGHARIAPVQADRSIWSTRPRAVRSMFQGLRDSAIRDSRSV